MPVMVTGGIRRFAVLEQVLASGIDMAGIGTALALDPNLPNSWRTDKAHAPLLRAVTWKNKVLASVTYMAMVKHQLRRLSHGKPANPNVPPVLALLQQQLDTTIRNYRYRQWVQA